MRVLVVTGIYPTVQQPHLGTFVKTQVDSLIEAGLEVEIIHPGPGPTIVRYVQAVSQVFLKTLSGDFDIVKGYYGQWCVFARLQWRTPVVASFLGSDLLGVVSPKGSYNKQGKMIIALSRWLCRWVDAAIVQSQGMKDVLSGGNVFVIPTGIDFNLFHPIPRAEARAYLGWEQDRYYVLFGNDPKRPVKNFALAQAAIEHLKHRGISAELVVASGLSQTRLVQYINASNALLLSSFHEGSPNVVKETMACNVPVVSTDVGDVAQVIGRTQGCRVCPHDPVALAAGLEEALSRTEPTTGRADIKHLESSVIAQQIIALFAQITQKRGKRRTLSLS